PTPRERSGTPVSRNNGVCASPRAARCCRPSRPIAAASPACWAVTTGGPCTSSPTGTAAAATLPVASCSPNGSTSPAPAGRDRSRARCSVFALDHEVRAADRAGQLRLLPCELELRGELLGDLHPVGELESDR